MLGEGEADAEQVQPILFPLLRFERLHDPDRATRAEVAELLVELGDLLLGRTLAEADDQHVAHVPERVEVAVEAGDLVHRLAAVVGDQVQVAVGRGHQPAGHQLLAHELVHGLPVRVAGGVEEHDRHGYALAGLGEREQFERLVEGAEPAGQADEPLALLDEHQLAGEEVLHADVLVVAGDDVVGALLERQADGHPDGVVAPGALHSRLHDPRAGTGDDHPALLGEVLGHPAGGGVERVVLLGAGGAEDGDLRHVRGAGEHGERFTHFLQRRAGDLEVQGGRLLSHQVCGGTQQLLRQAAVGPGGQGVEQGSEQFVGGVGGVVHRQHSTQGREFRRSASCPGRAAVWTTTRSRGNLRATSQQARSEHGGLAEPAGVGLAGAGGGGEVPRLPRRPVRPVRWPSAGGRRAVRRSSSGSWPRPRVPAWPPRRPCPRPPRPDRPTRSARR